MTTLNPFTITALADWVQEPDDEPEGQRRALMAVELAKDGGALPEFLAEIAKPRRRVCPRCEGDGMIGDGYLCEPCNGTGYDRLA